MFKVNSIKMKTIIIEDNLATVKFYTALLNKEGIGCDYILSGKKALENISKMQNKDYQLVLLDMELPDVSGLKILEEIRAKFPPDDLPVLVVSGIHNENVISDVKEAGANEFITKPFKNSILIDLIHKLLKTKKG